MERIGIVIVDDHPLFLAGIKEILQKEDELFVLGQANDGNQAIELVRKLKPHVVVMDITMPGMNGIEATREIRAMGMATKVLALSIHSGKQFVKDMLDAGAAGYLLKDSAPDELVQAIRKVQKGDIYLDSSITGLMLSNDPPEAPAGKLNILQTKLHRPFVTEDIIHRSRIVEVLQKNVHKPFSLISAPAGYGKSMAVSQWLEHTPQLYTWLSLDEEHNDLRVFLLYLQAAIEKIFPGALAQTGPLLQANELPKLKTLSYAVINDLDGIDQDFIVVLDDYHRIRDKNIHHILDDLIHYPPEHMHLSMITRIDPPLRIESLLAHERMTELRMSDLSFTSKEISDLFLNLNHWSLGEETAEAIAEKTEGWIVSLRMAFYGIENQEDASHIISGLKGEGYALSLYLINEVISKQPEEVKDLLLKSSILDRFCPRLIDSIGINEEGEVNAGSGVNFVKWLIKSNLFIIPLDDQRTWFRYHHLIRDLLMASLKKQATEQEVSHLHELASQWFEQQGFIEEAIKHMLDAGNPEAACDIVERNRWAELDADKWYVVQRWIEKIPIEARQKRPVLLLTECWPLYENFHLAKLPPILEQVEAMLKANVRTEEEELWGEVYFFYGAIFYWSGMGDQALEYFTKAQKYLSAERKLITGLLQLLTGLSMCMIGQGEEAVIRLGNAARETESEGGIFLSRLYGGMFFVNYFLGNLAAGWEIARRALDLAKRSGIAYSGAWNLFMEACADLQSNKLEQASRLFSEAVGHRYILHTRGAIDAVAGLALTQQLLGQQDRVRETCDLMVEFARELEEPLYMSVALSCRAHIALLNGDLKAALEWESTVQETPSMAGLFMWLEVPVITQARVLISEGSEKNLLKASGLLEEVLKISEACHFLNHIIEVAVLQTMLLEKQNQHQKALKTLTDALIRAEPGPWLRPFIEAGREIEGLLGELNEQGIAPGMIHKLHHAFERPIEEIHFRAARPPKVTLDESEDFTRRELEIIQHLSEGLRNKEIAQRLYVSEGTIKKHLYNMCQKLEVSGRMNLLRKASALNYLSS